MELQKRFAVYGVKGMGEKLPENSHIWAGSFNRLGTRLTNGQWSTGWFPWVPFRVPGSFLVKRPSENFPHAYKDHFYSEKYFRLLRDARPDLMTVLLAVSIYQRANGGAGFGQADLDLRLYAKRLFQEKGVIIPL